MSLSLSPLVVKYIYIYVYIQVSGCISYYFLAFQDIWTQILAAASNLPAGTQGQHKHPSC